MFFSLTHSSASLDINSRILLQRWHGGLNFACSLPVRYHRASPPIRRCTKREIVQTSCLMLGAGETWNAINLKARELPRCSSLHCIVITIAAETSAFDVAPCAARNCGSSSFWVSLCLSFSCSFLVATSHHSVLLVREETNNSIVKTLGELIVGDKKGDN